MFGARRIVLLTLLLPLPTSDRFASSHSDNFACHRCCCLNRRCPPQPLRAHRCAALAQLASARQAMASWWRGYCPHGGSCKKGNKTVCCKSSRQAVVHSLASHLANSPYHNLKWENAIALADNDEFVVEVQAEEGAEGEVVAAEEPDQHGEEQMEPTITYAEKGSGKGKSSSSSSTTRPLVPAHWLVQRPRSPQPRSRSPRRDQPDVVLRIGEVQQVGAHKTAYAIMYRTRSHCSPQKHHTVNSDSIAF